MSFQITEICRTYAEDVPDNHRSLQVNGMRRVVDIDCNPEEVTHFCNFVGKASKCAAGSICREVGPTCHPPLNGRESVPQPEV